MLFFISRLRSRIAAPLLLVPLLACGSAGSQTRTATAPPVSVAQVASKTMPVELRAIGHVEAIARVAVKPRIGGELTRVWFKEGQTVRPGDVLFTIDVRPQETDLREAAARLAKDQATLNKAEVDARRYADLMRDNLVSRQQYDQVSASLEELRATVAADEAALESSRLQLSYCTIRAPIGGRTGNLMVTEGNLLKANDDRTLVMVNQMRPIYVTFSAPDRFLPAIRRHEPEALRVSATLPDDGERSYEGTLSLLDNAVDATTGMILLRATFANEDEALWPGQFVDVVLTLGEEKDRIVAPAPAVQTGQDGTYVFVVKPDLTVELRPVRVSRMDASQAVIDKGLAAGETVVTDGHLRLVPGAKVELRSGPPGAPAAR